jgi:hypothetical protein
MELGGHQQLQYLLHRGFSHITVNKWGKCVNCGYRCEDNIRMHLAEIGCVFQCSSNSLSYVPLSQTKLVRISLGNENINNNVYFEGTGLPGCFAG